MKSFKQWKLHESTDPEWDQLKHVWGSGAKHVDPRLVGKMHQKVQSIIQQEIRDLHDPKVTNFREMPPGMRDSLAQSLVVAVLKAFYAEAGAGVTGGTSILNTKSLGQFQSDAPDQQVEAPSGQKG